MTGALVILVVLIVIGVLLYVTDKTYFQHHHSQAEEKHKIEEKEAAKQTVRDEICCGQHIVCEKTSLSVVTDEIIYYDDEELDRFAGRAPESYSPQETEEFRDILLTLLPQDVAGWARSITLRKIELPPDVKDELLLIISELRSGAPSPAV